MAQTAWSFEILAPKRIKSEVVTAYSEDVILDIYNSIGVKAKIIFLPEYEINSKIKSSKYDAILSKITDHGSIPHSLQLSPPLIKDYKVFRWTLKGVKITKKRFKVGAIKGVLAHTKTVIENRAKIKGIKYFKTYPKMLQAMKEKKIDSILLSYEEYLTEFSEEMKAELDQSPKVLLTTDLNHYINIKHQALYEKLTAEFVKRDKAQKLNFNDFKKTFKSKIK